MGKASFGISASALAVGVYWAYLAVATPVAAREVSQYKAAGDCAQMWASWSMIQKWAANPPADQQEYFAVRLAKVTATCEGSPYEKLLNDVYTSPEVKTLAKNPGIIEKSRDIKVF